MISPSSARARWLVVALALAALTAVVLAALALAAPGERRGSPPPVTVRIVAPKAGAVVRGAVTLRASATARAGVRSVAFRIDGKVRWTARRRPYVAFGPGGRWRTGRERAGRHRITVTVVDRRGRSARATRNVIVRRTPASARPARAAPRTSPAPSAAGPPLTAPPAVPASVPPSVWMSPTGSDGNSCTSPSTPCKSFDRAYRVARPGQVVEMAGGTYPEQNMSADVTKTAPPVVFRPAPGASVRVNGELYLNGTSHLELQGISLFDWYLLRADDVTFRNIDTNVAFISSSSNVSILGGDYGPYNVCTGQCSSAVLAIVRYTPSDPRPRNILIDGAYFHDETRDPGEHAQMISWWSVDNGIIRNSRFKTCAVFCVFVANFNDNQPSTNLTIENNWFECGSDCEESSGSVSFYANNILLRNNSVRSAGIGPNSGDNYPSTNARMVGNVGFNAGCYHYPWLTYSHNVWTNAACGPTDIAAPDGFLNGPGFDFHLKPGAAAINRGDPADFPPADIDGQARPIGGAPDAGADEAG